MSESSPRKSIQQHPGSRDADAHDPALAAVSFAADGLLRKVGWSERVANVLSIFGEALVASRVALYSMDTESGQCELKDQWHAPHAKPRQHPPLDCSKATHIGEGLFWKELLMKGETVAGLPRDFDEATSAALQQMDIRSVILLPVFGATNWWGFLAVDDCLQERTWSTHEREALRAGAALLGAALQRRQTEERLHQAEEDLEALVEQLPAITFRVEIGPTPRTIFISPQVEELLGYTPEEWLAQPELWKELLHPDDRERVVSTLEQCNQTGDASSLEYRTRTREGEERWFRNEWTCLKDEAGQPFRAYGMMVDITSRKEAERREELLREHLAQARRLESMGLLAGGVAHKLNNILGPLVAYPDMVLARVEGDETATHDLLAMKRAAAKATDVIQDLLALARCGHVEHEPLDLNALINEHLHNEETQALRARFPGVHLACELDPDLPPVRGAPLHIHRLMSNLVAHAFQAMPRGGDLTLQTLRQRVTAPPAGLDEFRPGIYTVLRVCDTGIPLNEEERERIFEPCFKHNRYAGGTGLGLAVVHGVMQDLGGYVTVESKPEWGSCFVLYFPATSSPVRGAAAGVEQLKGNERILVVDDEEEQRELAVTLLGYAGYDVATAGSGREALAVLEQGSFDLVVLDMVMEEDFDGLDTYRVLARKHPETACVLASGFAETGRVREARVLGAGQFVRKPYTLQTLCRAVRAELDRAKT